MLTDFNSLIAIMLGRLRMSTKEALQEYDNCAAEVFSSKNLQLEPTAWFSDTGLKQVVENLVERRNMGQLMRDPSNPSKGKTMVCVMPAKSWGEPRIVRSWANPDDDERWDKNVTIVQAARATTAAPIYFEPEILGDEEDQQPYIDAAVGVNNPINYLLKEAVIHFGSSATLGCVMSIGTGTRHVKLQNNPKGLLKGSFCPLSQSKPLLGLLKNSATSPEKAHRMLQARVSNFPGVYYRFSVTDAAGLVGLSQYKKISELKQMTATYLSNSDIQRSIQQAARQLQESSFDYGLTLGHISLSALII
jgi:Patatin